MHIVVICNEAQKAELLTNGFSGDQEPVFLNDPEELNGIHLPSAIIDLQFQHDPARIKLLGSFLPALVIINSVSFVLLETNTSFVRINGWSSFLSSTFIEASCISEELKKRTADVFQQFNKTPAWLPDVPGFVTPRVVSMIINEAFLALEEGVSTKEEMDTAMKLGTNYPFGPFEWANKIGIDNVLQLLKKLSFTETRYLPSFHLIQAGTAS